MLPLFYTILHFVKQDVKFVDKADFNAEWSICTILSHFAFATGDSQKPWIYGYDVENNYDDGLNEWFYIFDALLRALKAWPVASCSRPPDRDRERVSNVARVGPGEARTLLQRVHNDLQCDRDWSGLGDGDWRR